MDRSDVRKKMHDNEITSERFLVKEKQKALKKRPFRP